MYHPTPKTSSSKYKGVVPQSNGRWGAQIYENHHRVWLGTFDTQEAAALTYDRAAAMSRGSDATLNLHPNYYTDLNINYVESAEQHQQNPDDEDEEEEETIISTEIGDVEREREEEREYMFEKPLTPSDVGKLNRLVIPKQYAEKYFPLSGDSGDKGLLLSFEDESGKFWRFRYSYWNSSQSYVLTKGWSRFVKEKRLDAGDVVSFERRRFDAQRLFIRWRRRVVPVVQDSGEGGGQTVLSQTQTTTTAAAWTRVFYSAHPYPSHQVHGPLLYQSDHCLHAGYAVEQPAAEKPKANKPGNSKRLRLFGVNLDCQLDESDGSSLSSQDRTQVLHSQGVGHGSNQP